LIKTPKKQSSKLSAYLHSFVKRPYTGIIIYSVLVGFFYIIFPFILTFHRRFVHPVALLLYYLSCIAVVVYFVKTNSYRLGRFKSKSEELRERINLLRDESQRENKNKTALQEKIKRYEGLKNIIEEISQSLTLDSIAEHLVSIAFSVISGSKGNCILYLVDNQTQRLSIFKSRKEDKGLIIKAKEGDAFDFWVLRHTSPLLIEDIKRDFRFDPEQLKSQYTRPVSSLISAPFTCDHTFIGILRLDSPQTNFYSQDDLRILVSISELGALALENGLLFQKVQDLAIHDGLTSLYRKDYALERLKEECKKIQRKGSVLSLLMIDIDYFKNYNDQFGHSAGDIVLRTISQTLTEVFKPVSGSVIGRFGGEEFCVVLPSLAKTEALTYAEKLRGEIEKTKIILRRVETNVTVSIGVSAFPEDAIEEMELILKADRALYAAKQAGRNRVAVNK